MTDKDIDEEEEPTNTRDPLIRIPQWLPIALRFVFVLMGSSSMTTQQQTSSIPRLVKMLDDRVEISTPVNSFKRLIEGLFLFKMGIPPYEGGVFHQAPLLLGCFGGLTDLLSLFDSYSFNAWRSNLVLASVWIFADWIIANCLVGLAKYKLEDMKKEVWPAVSPAPEEDTDLDEKTLIGVIDEEEEASLLPQIPLNKGYTSPLEDTSLYPKDNDPTRPVDIPLWPGDIGTIYLLNPFSILTCLARNTQLFSTLSITTALYFAAKGNRRASMLCLAFGTYLSLYPVLLIAPCILFLSQFNENKRIAEPADVQEVSQSDKKEEKSSKNHTTTPSPAKPESLPVTIIKSILGLSFYTGGLLYLSFLLIGDWSFLRSTYGVLLFVDDLRPNVGLFWYFFMEVFDQFRTFFLTVFHLNAFVFTIPICIKFSRQPLLASFLICVSISLFKSYPSIADVPLHLSILSMQPELFKYSPHLYLSLAMLIYASLLGPLFFNSWVYAGGGNANFFYAITLVWAVGQIVLVVDVVYGSLKRDWERLHPGWRRSRAEILYQY